MELEENEIEAIAVVRRAANWWKQVTSSYCPRK